MKKEILEVLHKNVEVSLAIEQNVILEWDFEKVAEELNALFAKRIVGWQSEQLPDFDVEEINEILQHCKENKEDLQTLICRIWNRGFITGVNSEAEISSK